MGELGGFLRIERVNGPERPVAERVHDYREYQQTLPAEELREQGARCMECGVPFCHNGCPLGNLIPDWNDLVYRDRWKDAIEALHATNNFPEFTGRICPAPCEAACVLDINDDAVTIKQIEVAIIDRAYEEGWVRPRPPAVRSGRRARGDRLGSGRTRRRRGAQPLRPRGHRVRAQRPHRRPAPLRRAGLQARQGCGAAAGGHARGGGHRVPHGRRGGGGHRRPRAAPAVRRDRDRHRLDRPARPAGPGPRARRRALRDGVPRAAQPLRGRRPCAGRRSSPPPASTW